MELNKNSFSAKLYRWFYGTETMPKNLCPYFWKLVIAYPMAVPLLIVTLPHEIIYFKSRSNDENIGERIFVSFVIVLLFLAAFGILSAPSILFGYNPPKDQFMHYVVLTGAMLWVVGIVAGVVTGVKYLIRKIKEPKRMYDEEGNYVISYKKKPNIVAEFIKAKYNKYCPKIDWQDERNIN
jgi:hypothetical protein